MKERIFYSLNEEDIQFVAKDVLNRKLSKKELQLVKDNTSNSIKWFDIIEHAIIEEVKLNKKNN